jgi:homoserine O-acetyltransferase/O-succinyltransferase
MEHVFHYQEPFLLESGQSLPGLQIAYHTYGSLNADQSNVVWVCHALTANADVQDWWPGVVGPGGAIDPERHFIVCANIVGSCYGSSGPLSPSPDISSPWYSNFPQVTIRDMVQAHQLLFQHLGLSRIYLLMGGSMGGYQALEWCCMFPQQIEKLFLIATSAKESAWGIAIHTAQRMAIETDSSWKDLDKDAGRQGLRTARAIGMLTYRNYGIMVHNQSDRDSDKTDDFKASSYIEYQGTKLANRFHAYSYWLLTKAMDSHHIARGRGRSLEAQLQQIQQPTFLIGIDSDLLCPPAEQAFMAAHMPHAKVEWISSMYGHDGFLVEAATIRDLLSQWLA